ncbi:MAG: Crp/Fnr family transcriptional regulator [Pseudorhodobacter sp.]|jgi:CRP-like cAMP-binding protein|nr:Crp/Fnr family transcriptional regulator [Pseudorhodobacter sp.]
MHSGFSHLFDAAPERSFAPGAPLFYTGDRVQQMALVRAGGVLLERVTRAGVRVVLQNAPPGQVVSEASAYSETYHCGAVASATQGARLAFLPVAVFRSGLAADTATAEAWAAHLAHAVQAARLRAELRSLRRVSDRLDAWLGERRALPERGQWHDLAAELGVSPEALYRELARRR